MKDVFEVWETPHLLKLIESKELMHENDGLIFTADKCPYYPEVADNDILKWKPPILNTIDFELVPFPIKEMSDNHVWGLYTILKNQPHLYDVFMFDRNSAQDFVNWVAQFLKVQADPVVDENFNVVVKKYYTMLQGAEKKKVIVEFNHRSDKTLPLILLRLLSLREDLEMQALEAKEAEAQIGEDGMPVSVSFKTD